MTAIIENIVVHDMAYPTLTCVCVWVCVCAITVHTVCMISFMYMILFIVMRDTRGYM